MIKITEIRITSRLLLETIKVKSLSNFLCASLTAFRFLKCSVSLILSKSFSKSLPMIISESYESSFKLDVASRASLWYFKNF